MSGKEVIVKLARDSMWYNRYSPWKIYKIGVSFGFGVTFVSNTATGLICQSELNPYTYPGWFFSGVVLKSVGYGIIFPAIPIKLMTDPIDYVSLK
jgi:hypothetical protein